MKRMRSDDIVSTGRLEYFESEIVVLLKGRSGVIENYRYKEWNLLKIVSNIRYGKRLGSIFVDAQTVMYSVKVTLQKFHYPFCYFFSQDSYIFTVNSKGW